MGSSCSGDAARSYASPSHLEPRRDSQDANHHGSGHLSADEQMSASSNILSRTTPAPDEEYLGSVMPVDEEARHQTLEGLKILDTKPEKRFDDITKMCTMIFKVPMCLVSLVDSDRQWFKSAQGLDATETSRKSSFCAWTLLPVFPELLVVENALDDARFRNNPLVIGFPHIRFYGGTPLVSSDNKRLGSLCIIDTKPRTFDAESGNMLANFGEMVVRELERDKMLAVSREQSARLITEKSQLLRAINCYSEAVMLINSSEASWPVMFVNESWSSHTGIDHQAAITAGFWDLFQLQGKEDEVAATREACLKAIASQFTFNLEVMPLGMAAGSILLEFRSAKSKAMGSFMPMIGIPSNLTAALGEGPCYYHVIIKSPNPGSLPKETSPTAHFSIINDKIDPFEDVVLGPMLGRGAFGRVYRGTWKDAAVAVKVLEHTESANGEMMEALLSSQVSHPHVVKAFKHCTRTLSSAQDTDCCQLQETWIVMEFCNKGTLSDAVEKGWFRRKHSLFDVDYASLLKTWKEIAGGLAYLHSLNILHGDLTGNNVMLSEAEAGSQTFVTKVLDFGFSRVLEGQDIKTKNYATVTHTPPELLIDGTLSKATDVYAFGVIVWETYMGQRPFSGMTQSQIIHHISSRRMLSLPASCPPPLRKLFLSCCNPKHEQRPSFIQILAELNELEEELV